MSDNTYYKIRSNPKITNDYQLIKCNIKDHGFYDTLDQALEAYKKELINKIEYAIDNLIEARQEQSDFNIWLEKEYGK